MEGSAKRTTKFEGASFSYEPSFDAARFAIASLASGKSAPGVTQGFDLWVSGFGSAAIERRFGRVLHVELDLLAVAARRSAAATRRAASRPEVTPAAVTRKPSATTRAGTGQAPKRERRWRRPMSCRTSPLQEACFAARRGAIANREDDLQAAAWFLINERVSSSSMSAFTPLSPGRSKTSSWGDSAKLSVGVRISPRKSRTGFVVFPMT
jgi:hypothetical protein